MKGPKSHTRHLGAVASGILTCHGGHMCAGGGVITTGPS